MRILEKMSDNRRLRLELKKIKYEKLYCKHDWELKEKYDSTNNLTGRTNYGSVSLYICKKCGKFKKIDINDYEND